MVPAENKEAELERKERKISQHTVHFAYSGCNHKMELSHLQSLSTPYMI